MTYRRLETRVPQVLIIGLLEAGHAYGRSQRERELEEVRQTIKESALKVAELRAKLDTVPLVEQKQHPLRIEWIRARTLYWDKIAEMRDIENGKSVTKEEP